MTWQEFKAAAEARGMTDTTNVWFIDVQGAATGVAVQTHDRLGMALVSASAPASPDQSAAQATTESTETTPEASEPTPTTTTRSRR